MTGVQTCALPIFKTNAKAKSINIPATIKANGITYKVTTIAAKAFKIGRASCRERV